MKIKYIILPLMLMLLCGVLALGVSAAEGSGFNAALAVDRTQEANGTFTVTVQHSDVLASRKPLLRLPCTYETATVTAPDGSVQDGVIAGGEVSFRVAMGGTYTIVNGGSLTRVEYSDDFSASAIPEAVADKGIDTVEKLEKVMKNEIRIEASGDCKVETVLYDVKLMHSDDGGKSWVEVSKEYFKTHDKLLVSLPAPKGTSPETHAYSVVHMKDNGETETPKVNPRKDGGEYYLDFYVTSLSPILVAWTEIEEEEEASVPNYLLLMLLKMKQEYNIIVEPTEGGSVVLTDEKVKFGKSTTFTVIPDIGYGIGSITVNNRTMKDEDGVVTLNRIGRDQIIKVIFDQLDSMNP